jgi:hypothetical protein
VAKASGVIPRGLLYLYLYLWFNLLMHYTDEETLDGRTEAITINGSASKIKELSIQNALVHVPKFLAVFSNESEEQKKAMESKEAYSALIQKIYRQHFIYINELLKDLAVDLGLNCLINPNNISKDCCNFFEAVCKQNDIVQFAIRLNKSGEESGPRKPGLPIGALHTVAKIIKWSLWPNLNLLNYKEVLSFGQMEVLTKLISDSEKLQMLNDKTVLIYAIGACFADKKNKIPELENLLFEVKGLTPHEIERAAKAAKRKSFFKEKSEDKDFVLSICKDRATDPLNYYTQGELDELI